MGTRIVMVAHIFHRKFAIFFCFSMPRHQVPPVFQRMSACVCVCVTFLSHNSLPSLSAPCSSNRFCHNCCECLGTLLRREMRNRRKRRKKKKKKKLFVYLFACMINLHHYILYVKYRAPPTYFIWTDERAFKVQQIDFMLATFIRPSLRRNGEACERF